MEARTRQYGRAFKHRYISLPVVNGDNLFALSVGFDNGEPCITAAVPRAQTPHVAIDGSLDLHHVAPEVTGQKPEAVVFGNDGGDGLAFVSECVGLNDVHDLILQGQQATLPTTERRHGAAQRSRPREARSRARGRRHRAQALTARTT